MHDADYDCLADPATHNLVDALLAEFEALLELKFRLTGWPDHMTSVAESMLIPIDLCLIQIRSAIGGHHQITAQLAVHGSAKVVRETYEQMASETEEAFGIGGGE